MQRAVRLSIALILILVAGAAGPALAGEPAAPQAGTQQTPLPAEPGHILAPAPQPMAPLVYSISGPCTVRVTCLYSPAVSCSSDAGTSCQWRNDYSPTYPGFVQCGSYTNYCRMEL
jgi:hypothetical protein